MDTDEIKDLLGCLLIKQDKSDSLEIKCNAKQQYSWECKVYFDSSTDNGIEEAIKRIENTIEKLKLRLLK